MWTPFKDQTFDVVLLSEVLEHVPETTMVVRELFRLSKKAVLITTPNEGLIRRLGRRFSKSFVERTDAGVGHVAIFPFRELLSKLRAPGWEIQQAFTTHVFPPTLDEISVPPFLIPLVRVLECVLNTVVPELGTVSIVLLVRKKSLDRAPPEPM
jgi:hypothetical protein